MRTHVFSFGMTFSVGSWAKLAETAIRNRQLHGETRHAMSRIEEWATGILTSWIQARQSLTSVDLKIKGPEVTIGNFRI